MFAKTSWCAIGALAFAASANAGIMGMEWSSNDLSALNLGADGAWSQPDDYDYDAQHVYMFETWMGGFGSNVLFDIAVAFDQRTPSTDIVFSKIVTNTTDFFWSSFEIVLTPGLGTTISDVVADPNLEFMDVNVMAGGGGSWIITWDQFTGTGVGIGESTKFSFGFNIDGNLGFMMKQTPIPTPGAIALLGAAGLCAARRRRSA